VPLLSVNALEKTIDPLLRSGGQVYCIVVSGMRLDQYLGIEETIRPQWKVQRGYFYSILPTDTLFARPALLGGAFPCDIAGKNADMPAAGWDGEVRLLQQRLAEADIRLSGPPLCIRMTEAEGMQAGLEVIESSQLVVIVADFINLLTGGSAPAGIVQEIAPGERALRSVTRTWFENSALRRLLTELARKKCTIVLTSDHGIVYCTRKTEVYKVKSLDYGLRYKFGRGIAADERRVVIVDNPARFGLPCTKKSPSCVIAKEDYYLAPPESFSEVHRKSRNAFQQGGISMDEMIMPLAVCTPL
jgi:hypothetical protein